MVLAAEGSLAREPSGASRIESFREGAQREAKVEDGDPWAHYHNELADADAYRQGVGISRINEGLLDALRRLKEPEMAQLLQDDVLAWAKTEAATLKPHLLVLNVG